MNLYPEEFKEVFTIFKAEAVDQIKTLNNGLLELEKNPSNQSNLEEIFRTAHSLKGSSRMLGIESIGLIAHELESFLGKCKSGSINGELYIDLMYEGVDRIDDIVKLLSKSDKADLDSVDVYDLVNRFKMILEKANAKPSEKIKSVKEQKFSKNKERKNTDKKIDQDYSTNKIEQAFNIDKEILKTEKIVETTISRKIIEEKTEIEEFIRIPTQQIDQIMNLVSELVTSKIRNGKQLKDLYKIQSKTMTLSKEYDDSRELIQSLNKKCLGAIGPISLETLNENEVRNLLRLVINTLSVITPLNESLAILIQKKNNDIFRSTNLIDQLQEKVRDTRLLPLNTLLELMPRMVRDISKFLNKKIELTIDGGDTKLDKQILEEIKNPIIHIIRNCIDHGIELPDERIASGKPTTGQINICARYESNSVFIGIVDDGKGIDEEKILKKAIEKKLLKKSRTLASNEIMDLIFSPGFSTSEIITDISGRGVGMDIVRTNIERLKGVITIQSEKGKGTNFQIRLPLTLATMQVLIIESHSEQYTIPLISIDSLLKVKLSEINIINNKSYISIDGNLIAIMKLDDLLEKPRRFKYSDEEDMIVSESQKESKEKILHVVVCHSADRKIALIVDRLIDEQDVIIKKLGSQFKHVRNVLGVTILGNGELAIILDPADLVRSAYLDNKLGTVNFQDKDKNHAKTRVLVVDDSITTRTLEKNILEQAGYDITISVNGQEAWEILGKKNDFDIVVTDIEMPFMNGFELVDRIKKSKAHKHLPCILCTSLESEEDKRRGVEVGASAYITKGSFDQRNLLSTIERLI